MSTHDSAEKDAPRNRIEWHKLRAYRYRVADPGLRVMLNRYPGVVIGAAAVVGRFAYCVKWGNARVIPSAAPGDSLDDHEERYFPSHYEPGVFPSTEGDAS